MAVLPILHQAKGPLPITVSFKSPSDAPSNLFVAGSVWTTTANTLIGIEVELDGKPIGSASIFSNLASTHREVVPSYIPVKVSIGEHQLVLRALTSATTTDANDFFEVALLY